MIRTQLSGVTRYLGASVLLVVIAALGVLSCAGPQPLHMAINQHDEDAYRVHLNESNGDATTAYANWIADERGTTATEILEVDKHLSGTRNLFDGYRDPEAASRGDVIDNLHCASCHADDARGYGPHMPTGSPAPDFKTFGKRLASTLHRGAPKTWLRVIQDGSDDESEDTGGRQLVTSEFRDKLTLEQIWLAITYLQSLNGHAYQSKHQGHKP